MFYTMRSAIILAAIIPSLSWAALLPRVTEPITPSADLPSTSITDTPQVDSTCLPYTPGVLVLEAWGTSASSFCTSWEPITTVIVTATTSTTSTITAPTSTVTARTASTVTVTTTRTVYSTTVTITSATAIASSTSRRCDYIDKRDLTVTIPVPTAPSPSTVPLPSTVSLPSADPLPSTVPLPANAPTALSAFASSYIVSACECLHLPTPTSTTTTTVIESTTTTPVTTYTPTATTTTTSTVTTASTLTVPGVVLAHPTAITSVDDNGYATSNYDDGYVSIFLHSLYQYHRGEKIVQAEVYTDKNSYFQINLPFPLQLYGQNSSSIYMGVNGWISISNDPTQVYVNSPLPARGLPRVVFAGYWSDLYVYSGTKQGLYYQVDGSQGSRTASFEWYTSTYGNSHGYYHFIASFQENNPGAVTYDYYELTPQIPTTDNAYGTVGVQRFDTSQYAQFSFNNTRAVNPNMRVFYLPNSNTFDEQYC